MKKSGISIYGPIIEGSRYNYNKKVKFDYTDGYIGISQWEGDFHNIERVLLTPKQVDELNKFIKRNSRSR